VAARASQPSAARPAASAVRAFLGGRIGGRMLDLLLVSAASLSRARRSVRPQPRRRFRRLFYVYTECAMSRPLLKLRYSDLVALPDDGKRHELIDGEHYVSASPYERHQRVSGNVNFLIAGFVRPRRLGKLYYAPLDVFLSEHDIVVPDLVYVRRERLGILEERFLRGAPDLAVEVLSPSTRQRDLRVKRLAYRKFGFGEYWIIDPVAETIAVFRGEGDWNEPVLRLTRASGPQAFTSPLFPGLVLTLDQVFE
jgi:Uma2 family endonuclease